MKLDILLRSATSEDASAVAGVLIQSRAEHLQFAPSAHSPDDLRTWVADRFIPTTDVIVAEHEGQVIGVLATSYIQGTSWIDQMYVQPGWTGVGVGKQLLDHAHQRLPRPIRLYTFQANVGARRFYERHGYQAIELTDGQTNEERCPDVLYELR